MVSTHLKNIGQNGNLPQIGVNNTKKKWNHHLVLWLSEAHHTFTLLMQHYVNMTRSSHPQFCWDRMSESRPFWSVNFHGVDVKPGKIRVSRRPLAYEWVIIEHQKRTILTVSTNIHTGWGNNLQSKKKTQTLVEKNQGGSSGTIDVKFSRYQFRELSDRSKSPGSSSTVIFWKKNKGR